MLTYVEGINRRGTVLALPLTDEASGFVISEISGLDPVKATLSSTGFAQIDGETYTNARRESRNVVIKLDLDPDYITTTVEDLRNQLYAVFMPKTEVTMRFHKSDDTYVTIIGRVESCDVPLFTDEPTADISVMCFKPDFLDPNLGSFTGTSVVDSVNGAYSTLTYRGTVDTGFVFKCTVIRDMAGFVLNHIAPDGTASKMTFNYPLLVNDIVEISTVQGKKYAQVTRAGVTTSVLYSLTPESPWVQLQQGDNQLRLYVDVYARPYTVSYVTRYGGL